MHLEGCDTSPIMKLKLNKVMFINLIFRILLLIYLLRDSGQVKKKEKKPAHYWLDPLSERVFLIFVNGLQADFLEQNATPYLKDIVENRGSFGVARSGYMETNLQGLRTVLSGKYSPVFPFSWLHTYCEDSILDYVGYKCGIGQIPKEIPLRCRMMDKRPLETSLIFPRLLQLPNKYKSNLILMNFDLDPVLVNNYQTRLRQIDADIRFLAEVVDRAYVNNKTTFIVTSARGSPVDGSLSIDSPVIVWGNAIAPIDEITFLGKGDLTAMLCVLLGISFPSKLFGIIPTNMLELPENYEYDLNLYTITHFEKVLQVVNSNDYLIESSELQLQQLETRLDQIIMQLKRSKILKMILNAGLLVLLLMMWGFNLILFTTSGHAYFYLNLKSLFLLILLVGATVFCCTSDPDLVIMVLMMMFWTWQNRSLIRYSLIKKLFIIFLAVALTFVAVTVVGLMGSRVALRLFFVPVIMWTVLNGTYKRLNRFVLVTRLLTGVILGALPHSKVFGETPDNFVINIVCFLFLINFYILLYLFKRQMDIYSKINFLMIFATILCFRLPPDYTFCRHCLCCFLLALSFLVTLTVSGTLLTKTLKIYLSLFIPVLMLTIKVECIFYLSIVFHLFTWVFVEYHNKNLTDFQFYSSIFSIQPNPPLKTVRFSEENVRHVVFFIIYCYVSYFAVGHFPDMHSYDLYVVPTFIYDYPILISYFLGGFKFFLPFFVVTMSFITLYGLKEMDFWQMIAASVCVSDLLGSFLVFYSQFFNVLAQRPAFPVRFSYFTILQFAIASVICSSFVGDFLLLSSESLFQKIFKRKKAVEQNL